MTAGLCPPIVIGARRVRDSGEAMASEAKLLTLQFLQWLAVRPRSNAELRDAWSSTCPLTCAWEDAICDDLVERTADGHLVLSERGRVRLTQAACAIERRT